MDNIKVDVRGETCPIPLIKARRAMKKSGTGVTIEIIGDHAGSKKEIPMAVEALKHELVDIKDGSDGSWTVIIRTR